jgi:hypothetical protein
MNDETLYVAPSDKRTDYSQPPMSSFYYGVLNTGRRRYAHPALSGSLPFPWLPAKAKPKAFGDGAAERRGVVLSLRRKVAKKLRASQTDSGDDSGSRQDSAPQGWSTGDDAREASASEGRQVTGEGMASSQLSSSSNPWGEPAPSSSEWNNNRLTKKLSFDPGSGVIAMPDEGNVWGDEPSESDGEEDRSPGDEPPISPVSSSWFCSTSQRLIPSRHTSITQRGEGRSRGMKHFSMAGMPRDRLPLRFHEVLFHRSLRVEPIIICAHAYTTLCFMALD